MKERLFTKLGMILGLIVLLMIPLLMIQGVIDERSHFRAEVRQDIARSWTAAQSVTGPILVVPYIRHYQERIWDDNLKRYVMKSMQADQRLYLLPENLQIQARVQTDERRRGLYAVPVYSSRLKFSGHFTVDALQELEQQLKEGESIQWQEAFVDVAITDKRGVMSTPFMLWGEQSLPFVAGTQMEHLGSGMHTMVGALSHRPSQEYPFHFEVELNGMEKLHFTPVGRNTSVQMQADWPHPSFQGRFLPKQYELNEQGFSALWNVSAFASDMDSILSQCLHEPCRNIDTNHFGVSLYQPVDIYQQTERSVKYAYLFLVLTFVGFFLYEVMRSLRLHSMHYLLVGLALSIFYLLLVALSEHIAFVWAYVLAAVACTGLIGFYTSALFSRRSHALYLSLGLMVLYALLFGLLRSEENALLMGTLLLFVVLSLVMGLTRRLDWFCLSVDQRRPLANNTERVKSTSNHLNDKEMEPI